MRHNKQTPRCSKWFIRPVFVTLLLSPLLVGAAEEDDRPQMEQVVDWSHMGPVIVTDIEPAVAQSEIEQVPGESQIEQASTQSQIEQAVAQMPSDDFFAIKDTAEDMGMMDLSDEERELVCRALKNELASMKDPQIGPEFVGANTQHISQGWQTEEQMYQMIADGQQKELKKWTDALAKMSSPAEQQKQKNDRQAQKQQFYSDLQQQQSQMMEAMMAQQKMLAQSHPELQTTSAEDVQQQMAQAFAVLGQSIETNATYLEQNQPNIVQQMQMMSQQMKESVLPSDPDQAQKVKQNFMDSLDMEGLRKKQAKMGEFYAGFHIGAIAPMPYNAIYCEDFETPANPD